MFLAVVIGGWAEQEKKNSGKIHELNVMEGEIEMGKGKWVNTKTKDVGKMCVTGMVADERRNMMFQNLGGLGASASIKD